MRLKLKSYALYWHSCMEYQYQVNLFHSKGIPFNNHLCVPEVHPITGKGFCEREDEGHIFKVFNIHGVTCVKIF